ncbi:MAG: Asp-tRNA(Asn)/Glu-tRNA(Gln) amidotransferase subunit GatB [Elusimicrobia bacterium]|nr:Asp-tRNA(Asn)/Glu-tRNA(Gln) amidotransferase subunit GatB [Elusimicrobiota bacterium]MBI4217914.1 Asp-tRNA(Asn)/Glu-tRNA(Gln) amidotransferase subunit GatB [Elusimicrobiota bacterium]
MDYESVIGLEVHVQIKTESKLFCSCPTGFGASPNSQICPICTGQPGALPVLNQKAVESLVKTALALNCRVNEESIFARKQYFYPDLPKNYQISQYEKPLSEKGYLMISEPAKKVGITRIHLEEDAGKLLHTIGPVELKYSLVDLNRTGIPLMEIVSEPDISSPEEAQEYLSRLKMTLQYLEVSDCDMEKGSLRCDANISVRPSGIKTLGTKVELKNMNSFRGVQDAIAYEIERQIGAIRQGERIVQETRLWDAGKKESRPMRSKEEAHDYRYFPEPDLLPLRLESQWIENIRQSLPELPADKRNRFLRDYLLSEYDAAVLTSDIHLADFYEKTVKQNPLPQFPKIVSNWITTELLGRLNEQNKTILDSPISPPHLAELAEMILAGTISGKIAKTVFDEMWQSRRNPKSIVQEKGLTQVLDEKEIENWAALAIQQNPKAVEEFRGGKEKALQALIGSVMKLSKGKANPERVNQTLKKKLSIDSK